VAGYSRPLNKQNIQKFYFHETLGCLKHYLLISRYFARWRTNLKSNLSL